jgi:integrase/recombinase XerD
MSEEYGDRLGQLLRAFEGYLARTGHSAATRRKYLDGLDSFASWIGDRNPGSLRRAEIEEYLGGWWSEFEERRGRPPALGTYRAKITALKAFFAFLETFDYLVDADGRPARNVVALLETPRIERKPIDWLTAEEDDALLASSGTPNENILVSLLRYTGLRVDEARSLTIGDVNLTFGEESVRVRKSKTAAGKRTIPLAPGFIPRLEDWLDHLATQGLYRKESPLLTTANGTQMLPNYIWRAVKRAAFKVGVRPVPCTCGAPRTAWHLSGCPRTASGENLSLISPHTLRRTFGSDLINRGMSIEGISKLLGHNSVAVTQDYYAELLDTTVRNDFLSALGHGRWLEHARPTAVSSARERTTTGRGGCLGDTRGGRR